MESINHTPKNKYFEVILLALFVSLLFCPAITITPTFELRVDDAIILFLLPFMLLYKPRIHNNPLFITLSISIVSILISTFYGYYVMGVVRSIRDANEIVRLCKPILLVLVLSNADPIYLTSKIPKIMYLFGFLIILIGFIQYFNLFGLGGKIASLYAPSYHVHILTSDKTRRILLTGINPNNGAVISLLFLLFSIFNAVIYKNKIYYLQSLLLVVVTLMTSSRTAFLALIVVVTIFFFTSKTLRLLYKIPFVLLFITIIMLLFSKFQYISDGLTLAMSGENTSLLARFAHWDAALNEFYLSPIFGLGPGKGTMTTIVDGEYFLLLRRYGILGTMIICYTIFMMPFWQPNRTKPKSDKWIVLNYSIKYFSLVIFFTMITNSFFSGYQLFLPYVFLCTVSYRYAQQTEKQR